MLILISSCEQVVDIEMPEASEKIVIEGFVENGLPPYVYVTRNSSYFAAVNQGSLQRMLVTGATVIVTDGSVIDTLKPAVDFNVFPFLYYLSTKIIGEAGKTYDLKVIAGTDTVIARTTVPKPIAIDSLVFDPNKQYADTLGYVKFYLQDPPELGNFYRTFTKTLGLDSLFMHPFASVLDDKLVNGQYIEYPVYRGFNNSLATSSGGGTPDDDEGGAPGPNLSFLFGIGDTVVVKISTMDAAHYKFWYTIQQQMMSGGNPFAAPTTPYTNIKGGLGIWGGYGASFDTIIIKPKVKVSK